MKNHNYKTTVVSVVLCAAVWSIYGFIFYPGLISWDFYVQWHEMSGKIPLSDWHPFFYTITIWSLTRIWSSPAIVMIAQIFFMSIAVGSTINALQRMAVPRNIIIVAILFYSFFPLNGFYAVSLWKDIAYAVSFLWLNVILVKLYFPNKKKPLNLKQYFYLLSALFLVAMMRHNGIAISIATVFISFILSSDDRKIAIFSLSILLIVIILLVKFPVASLLHVDFKDKKILKSQIMIQHVGAVLNEEKPVLNQEDSLFLSNLINLRKWKKAYNPLSCMPLAFGKDRHGKTILNGDFIKNEQNYIKFIDTWKRLIWNNHNAILKYYKKSTSLVWEINGRNNQFIIPEDGLSESDLHHQYKLSVSKEKVGWLGEKLINLIKNPAYGWILSKGGLYFWATIFSFSFLFWVYPVRSVLILSTPVIVQTLTVAVFPLVQDTRFMFPIILSFPLFLSLCFSRISSSSPEELLHHE